MPGITRWFGSIPRGLEEQGWVEKANAWIAERDPVGKVINWISEGITNLFMPRGQNPCSTPQEREPELADIHTLLGRGEGFDAREATKHVLVVPFVATGMSAGLRFASQAEFLDHFGRHGKGLGYATSEAYLQGARNLVRGGKGVETFVRARDGATLFYRAATNEFAVVSKEGILQTYYAPRGQMRYC